MTIYGNPNKEGKYTFKATGSNWLGVGTEKKYTVEIKSSSTPTPTPIPTKIAVDAINFPDDKFRSYVSSKRDYISDGYLRNYEIEVATFIDVHDKEIKSLKGIEFFTYLQTLLCNYNQLTALDVTKNTALESLYCENNQLTALDLSKNIALKKISSGSRIQNVSYTKHNNGTYSVNIKNLVPDTSRVSSVVGKDSTGGTVQGNYDSATGIVTFTSSSGLSEVSYKYDTRAPALSSTESG